VPEVQRTIRSSMVGGGAFNGEKRKKVYKEVEGKKVAYPNSEIQNMGKTQ